MDYIERHFDYVLGPNQDGQLASVAAGKQITCVLKTDLDGPFVLRSRAIRRKYTTVETFNYANLQHVLARWYGPDRQYTSTNLIRQSLLSPYYGLLGNPIPQSPEIFYPPQSEIRVDIRNDGSAAITNLTFYFRGVKLYRPGAVKSYRYPAPFSTFPFTYPSSSAVGAALPIPNLAVTTNQQLVTFRCRTDADFALQGLQAGFIGNLDSAGHPVQEVAIILKDEDEKPYSNDFVHVDVLCGNSGIGAVFPSGTGGFVAPVACGPNSPGLVFPEIYIPKNQLFYIQFQRADSSYSGAAAVDYPFSLVGQKVFEK
jgi:hypothetical protein